MSPATAIVTSKGQVTIPKSIRDALRIVERSQLLFVLEGESVRVVPIGVRSLAELAGSLPVQQAWPGMAAARERYRAALVEQTEKGLE